MIDIVDQSSSGMSVYDTQTSRAANILSVQIGALEYEPDLGIDLMYFLDEPVLFQNESFHAYLIQTLASWGINVASVAETVENLYSTYTINLSPEQNTTGLLL